MRGDRLSKATHPQQREINRSTNRVRDHDGERDSRILPTQTPQRETTGEKLEHQKIRRGRVEQPEREESKTTKQSSIEHTWENVKNIHREGRYPELPRHTQGLTNTFVTDAGREIHTFFEPGKKNISPPEYYQHQRQKDGLADKVQQIGPPDPNYNCWGFAFTGGAGHIFAAKSILDDNGYNVTKQPRPGDVIIYYTPARSELMHALYKDPTTPNVGRITHAGLVSKVEQLADGTTQATEINSKWGQGPLYCHAPGDVPSFYGKWLIYQSERPGGSLLIPKPLLKQSVE